MVKLRFSELRGGVCARVQQTGFKFDADLILFQLRFDMQVMPAWQ